MRKYLFLLLMVLSCPFHAHAALHTQAVDYKHGDVSLEGYLAYDEKFSNDQARHPAVMIVHEWKGLGDYAKRRAEQLAELGYIAFAIDMYGKDIRPKTHEEAAKQSGIYRSDRNLMRSRARAGLETLKNFPFVDSARLAAIGYCFGGTTVLEMARAGEDLKGVASFHGGLSAPEPAEPGKVKAKVIAFHGASDPFESPSEVAAFKDEMTKAGVDFQFIPYEGAVHSFTVKEAGDDPAKGMAYNEKADKDSWEKLKGFLESVLKPSLS